MATVDDKVVAMSFESGKFESGVNKTIGAIGKLKDALTFKNAGKGLNEVDSEADKVNLGHIAKAIEGIKSKFSNLSVVAIAAIGTIVNKAVDAGLKLAKAFTIDPIKAGFHNYETQINAVQTIMANTGLKGKKGLGQVNAVLKDLNTYANKTVYNFSDMAKNIGTFTAAGVDLKTSAESIKGIANLAALSGSNSEQASSAMYQLSQAIASGKVNLQDWNSVVNAGMGGAVFQKALASTATAMGTLGKNSVKMVGPMKTLSIQGQSFRNSLSTTSDTPSWLTSDVLTTTLKNFTGDMTDAQLAQEGFSKQQIKTVQEQGQAAVHAATNIKTVTQLQEALKEEVATAYSAIFKTVFGNITEATKLFSKIHTVAENALTKPIYALNKLLEGWAKLGGRATLIKGLTNAFHALSDIMKPIKEAFRDIFPATTGQDLYNITKRFEQFTESLKPSPETVENIRRTFKGLFAVLDIGKQVLAGIFTVFGKVFGAVGDGSGAILNITGNIGDFLVSLDKALKKGGRLHDFFAGLGDILQVPIHLLGTVGSLIGGLFTGAVGGGGVSKAFDGISSGADNLEKKLKTATTNIEKFFSNLGNNLSNSLGNVNWGPALDAVNTGLLGGILLLVKKFFSKGLEINFAQGLIGNISESFDALTGSLKAMQQNVQADTLQKIAIAIGILAASILALSFVKPEALKKSLTAIAVGFGELLGAMKILTAISKESGFIKMPLIAGSLIALAIAIDLLAIAVYALSRLSWEQLAKGLSAVGVILGGLIGTAKLLPKSSTGMISAGVGLTAIAIGLNLMALAVKQFGGMSWEQLGKGLAAAAASLIAIGGAVRLFPEGMVRMGTGILAVAGGMKLLASAVKAFGTMSFVTLAKGIGAMGVSLGVLAIGLDALSGSLAGAAALTVAAVGIKILAPALKTLGSIGFGTIAKAFGILAASFIVLGVAGVALEPAIPAIIGLGAAVTLLGIGVAGIGLGIDLLGKGLSTLALTGPKSIKILVDAILSIAKTIPAVAIKFADGILDMVQEIAKQGPMLVTAMGKILGDLLDAIIADAPKLGQAITVLIQTILKVLQDNLPSILAAGINLLEQLLKGIAQNIDDIAKEVVTIVTKFVKAIGDNADNIVAAGANLLIKFVKGIADNIDKIASSAVDIIVKFAKTIANNEDKIVSAAVEIVTRFAKTIGDNLDKIVTAGADIITKFVNGIGNNISKIVDEGANIITKILKGIGDAADKIVTAGGDLVANIIKGVGNAFDKVVTTGGDIVAKVLKGIGDAADSVVTAGGNIIAHVLSGIAGAADKVITAGGNIIGHIISGVVSEADNIITAGANAMIKFVNGMASNSVKLVDAGARAILHFLNGIRKGIDKYEPQIITAGVGIGEAIVQGMITGVGNIGGHLLDKVGDLIKSLPNKALKLLGIKSPSKVFADIGGYIVQGLVVGIDDNADDAAKSMTNMVATMMDSISNVNDMQPVITPVLDLTGVQAGAKQMNGMINTSPVVATASYGQAASISSAQAQSADSTTDATAVAPVVTFEQNNYSPESLSPIDIYRQTKNQLSQARSMLAAA